LALNFLYDVQNLEMGGKLFFYINTFIRIYVWG
jgi:hypothetical protein